MQQMGQSTYTRKQLDAEIDRLVEQYRDRCLWFIREDYFPDSIEAQLSILKYIERYGDRDAFVQARELSNCLLRHSSGRSAV